MTEDTRKMKKFILFIGILLCIAISFGLVYFMVRDVNGVTGPADPAQEVERNTEREAAKAETQEAERNAERDGGAVRKEGGSESARRTCEYEGDLREEWDLPYVDVEGFAVIKELYAKVEFLGDFPAGDRERYEEYREKFRQMLDNQLPIRERETGEDFYFKDLENEWGEPISPKEYYYFDMDEDGVPELGVRDKSSCDIYYLKYEEETDHGLLWYELGNWEETFGSRKVAWLWDGGRNISFVQLDEEGEAECVVNSFDRWKNDDVSLHMVMLPVYSSDEAKAEIGDWLKEQGVFVQKANQWYFRVTEKQYNELTAHIWAAQALAEQEMEKVTYTPEELFGAPERTDGAPERWESLAPEEGGSGSAEERPYVSDAFFETLRAAYEEIDFFAEFESGDLDVYDKYTEKFLELLDGKIPAVDRRTGKEQYLRDYEIFQGRFEPGQYEYSLFDVNGDGLPELGLRYDCHHFDRKFSSRDYQEFIFEYDCVAGKLFLWHQGYGNAWTGTGKMQRRRLGKKPWYSSWGMSYRDEEDAYNEFIWLDENGGNACRVLGVIHQDGGDGLYMVTLPQYGDSETAEELSEERFFRVSAKQYYQLFACYEQAYWFAWSHEEDIVYTYEELHDWRAKYDPDPAVG